MISDELQNLLSLLAVTIFADKRVFAQEIETFLKTAESITEIRNVQETLSEAKLLAWFDANAENIRGKLQTPGFEPWFYGCLDKLAGLKDKQALLNIMMDISKADDEFHISEKALITLTASHWELHSQF